MIIPPLVLRLRVIENGRRKVRLWIPLFLVWPGLLLLGVALAPAVIAAAIILSRRGKSKSRLLLLSGPLLFYLACLTRGLKMDIGEKDSRIHISIW